MSGATPMEDGSGGLDVLAGEFVLGLLDEPAARALLARAQSDPALAAAIAAWQERFDPLADLAAPVQPRDRLWARIDAGLKAAPPPATRAEPASAPRSAAPDGHAPPAPSPPVQVPLARTPSALPPATRPPVARPAAARPAREHPAGEHPAGAPRPGVQIAPWRGLALASMALAAGLAAFIVWQRAVPAGAPAEPRAAALLATPGAAAATLRAQVTGAGTITIVPLQHLAVAPGRRLGFWAWPASEKAPVLLGMISPDGGQLKFPYPAREGTPVMVTSEPLTPTGGGPGPTLYLGLLVVSRG